MSIDRATIQKQKAIFERQLAEHERTLVQITGGIATCNHFLALLDKQEQQAGANDSADNAQDPGDTAGRIGGQPEGQEP